MDLNKIGWALIAVVFLAMLTIAAILFILDKNKIDIDPLTNCPQNEDINYPSTIILIDKTDPLSKSQKRYLKLFIYKLKSHFNQFEKVAVYSIDLAAMNSPDPLFERCNPGNPDDANIWTENIRQIRNKFEKDFSEPFNKVIENSVTVDSYELSPIIETIQSVMYNHGLDERISSQKLIIISDMFQNVKEYSHYRNGYDYQKYSKTKYSNKNQIILLDVEITLVYLWRQNLSPKDVSQHIAFWDELFNQYGSSIAHAYKVK